LFDAVEETGPVVVSIASLVAETAADENPTSQLPDLTTLQAKIFSISVYEDDAMPFIDIV